MAHLPLARLEPDLGFANLGFQLTVELLGCPLPWFREPLRHAGVTERGQLSGTHITDITCYWQVTVL
ncbi:MAG: hypothetical protein OEY41_04495 [Acidimicrobiia bacterium]|nr:hypothetical protein [Acidimicrobiia bacterium]MDH5289240.1 hypothetical protein [Acidimicrobiia bacterium]